MTLSDVIAALQRLTPIVGEAEVVLHDVGSGVETVIQALSVDVSPTGSGVGSTVTVKHGPAPTPAELSGTAAEASAPDPSAA